MNNHFKLKNTSIRFRLVISNLIMFFTPFLLVGLITVFSFASMLYRFDGNTLNSKLNDSMGFITVYRLQFKISDIERHLKRAGTGEKLDKKTVRLCDKLDNEGSALAVVTKDEVLYLTYGYTFDEFRTLAEKITGDNYLYDKGSLYTGPEGTYMASVTKNKSGESVYIFLCDTSLDNIVGGTNKYLPDMALEYVDTLMWFLAIFAIIITFTTDIILTIFISRSIIVPLEKLRVATNEIRDGNLECRIDYDAKNEIGDVCSDFEEMRQRLKESVEAQQRYENSWKEMVAGISHDMRTPLTSIKGYVSGLMDGIADTPKKQERYLKTIYSTACDMENLLNELFLFSKLESEKYPFNMEKVDLVSYFSDCYEELYPQLARREIKLVYENKIGESGYADVDRVQLKRAINNIIQNSVKYRKPDEYSEIRIILSETNDGMLVELSDNGMGVSEQELEKIFESFYRTDKARSNVRSGSGLGLAITQNIIDRHGGKIWASGSIGAGLTVSFLLPKLKDKEKNDG